MEELQRDLQALLLWEGHGAQFHTDTPWFLVLSRGQTVGYFSGVDEEESWCVPGWVFVLVLNEFLVSSKIQNKR